MVGGNKQKEVTENGLWAIIIQAIVRVIRVHPL